MDGPASSGGKRGDDVGKAVTSRTLTVTVEHYDGRPGAWFIVEAIDGRGAYWWDDDGGPGHRLERRQLASAIDRWLRDAWKVSQAQLL